MAKKLSEIYVDFTGRLGKLKGAMAKAKNLVKKGITTLGRIAKRGVIVIGAAIAAGIVAGIKAYISFEQQLAKVATMLDEQSMTVIPRFGRAMMDLAIKFGEATASIAEGLYQILSASVPVMKALKVLRASMRAAKAGFTDTATAAYALTGVMNAYGYAADKVSKVSDILFSIQKRGQTSFAQFAPTLGRVTGLAAAMKVKLVQVAAALATLTRSGISTAESITYLRGLIVSLAGRSKEGIKVAKGYGIELSAVSLETNQLSGMLKKLAPLSADAIKLIVSETEARTALNILLQNQAGFEKDLEVAMNSSGLTMEAYGKVAATLGEKFKRLWQSIKMFAIDLTKTFVPMIEKGVVAITEKFSGMRDKLNAIWEGTGRDFRTFIDILFKILSAKMGQLVEDMGTYGKRAVEAFFESLEKGLEKRGKKPWKYPVSGILYAAGKVGRGEEEKVDVKGELKKHKQISDAKIKAILKEYGIEEEYIEHLAELEKERGGPELEMEKVEGQIKELRDKLSDLKEKAPSITPVLESGERTSVVALALETKETEEQIRQLESKLSDLSTAAAPVILSLVDVRETEEQIRQLEAKLSGLKYQFSIGTLLDPSELKRTEDQIRQLKVDLINSSLAITAAAKEDAAERADKEKGAAETAKRFEEERREEFEKTAKAERAARIDKLEKLRDMYKAMKGYDKEYARVQKMLLKEQAAEYAKTGLVSAEEAYAAMVAKAKEAEKPAATAVETAKAGFVRFEAAWANIASQLMSKRIEEQQLKKQEELVQLQRQGNVNTENIRQAIADGEGGLTQ